MNRTRLLIVICLCAVAGCARLTELVTLGDARNERAAFENYDKLTLGTSSAADVLAVIRTGETELLSQSRSVIASQGQRNKRNVFWVNMVAFDENDLIARRKYLVVVNEALSTAFLEQRTGLGFRGQMVLADDILGKPFANDNARRIAIIRELATKFIQDKEEIAADNEIINVAAMMVNQALNTILVELDASPVLAAKLSEEHGLDFEHISLGKGRVKMVMLADDVAAFSINIGMSSRKF